MDEASKILQKALPVFPFLKTADEAFLDAFCGRGIRVELPERYFIRMEGNACTSLPLVLSGTIRVYKTADSGREITLYRIHPGESCILTASCILSNREFPAFAVAETDVRAIVVPAADLATWFHQHEAWRAYLFDLLARRLGSVIELVEEVAFRHMDTRLAAYLVQSASATEKVERTHEAVASDLGTSREVISRLLKDFEQEGLVALSRGVIHIRDEDSLARLEKKA